LKILRLYLPAVVACCWAIILFAFPLGHVVRAIAWLTIAVALKLQVDEARREYHLGHQRGEDEESGGDE
jgi:hypothetical protein